MIDKYDITGQKFSRLTVLKDTGERGKGRGKSRIYLCECDCGTVKKIRGETLKNGTTKSCGCLKQENLKPQPSGDKHSSWRGYEEISWNFIGKSRRRAKKLKKEFNVSLEYLWELFISQKRKCALSGRDLTFPASWKDQSTGNYTASLDRIDSNEGYTEGNVQWVHKHINQIKWAFSDEEFIQICKEVVKHCRKK